MKMQTLLPPRGALVKAYRAVIGACWAVAPPWAAYLAVDSDGEIWGFEEKPELTRSRRHWRSYAVDARAKYLGRVEGNYGRAERVLYVAGSVKPLPPEIASPPRVHP